MAKKATTPGLLSLQFGAEFGADSKSTLAEIAASFQQPTLGELARETLAEFEDSNRQTRERLKELAHESAVASFATKVMHVDHDWVETLRSRAQALQYQCSDLRRQLRESTSTGIDVDRTLASLGVFQQIRGDAQRLESEVEEKAGVALKGAKEVYPKDAEISELRAAAMAALNDPHSKEARIASARIKALVVAGLAALDPPLAEMFSLVLSLEAAIATPEKPNPKGRGRPPQTEDDKAEVEKERGKRDARLEGAFNLACETIKRGGGRDIKKQPVPSTWVAQMMLRCGLAVQTDTLQPYAETTLAKGLRKVTRGRIAWPKGRQSEKDGSSRDVVVDELVSYYKRGASETASGAQPGREGKTRMG